MRDDRGLNVVVSSAASLTPSHRARVPRPMAHAWRRSLRVTLAGLAVAGALALAARTSAGALECAGIALDDGCLFTITGGDTPNPDDGYAVTNATGVPLWDFVRERDLNAIGYPISQRWVDGPFTLQAFQKVILQWDPGKRRMNYYNTLDVLANRYPDVELPNVPPHQVLEADRGASFGAIIRNHLALLDQNPAISERFRSEPDWLNLYGLPIRYEEREVNGNPQGLQMLRAQRTVFVIWNVPAPGTTVGRVNLQNVPDKVKKLSNVIIPDAAKALRTESGPELPGLITALSWVADGITPLEQHVIDQLERIHAVSETLLRSLVEHPTDHFTRNHPNERKLASFTAMAEISELPWVKDGLSQSEFDQVQQLFDRAIAQPAAIGLVVQTPWVMDGLSQVELDFAQRVSSQAADSPATVGVILQKPWVMDGVTGDETAIVDNLLSIAAHESPTAPTEQTIAYRILNMPFLDSIEPYDPPAVVALTYIGSRSLEQLRRVVFHPSIPHGIHDHRAKILPVLWYAMERDPSQLDLLFDGSKTQIEERHITLPHTGPTILTVIRSQPGEEVTMNYLEGAVRSVEEAMRRPLPTNYIALHVSEVVDPWGGLYVGTHIAIREGFDDRHHYFLRTFATDDSS